MGVAEAEAEELRCYEAEEDVCLTWAVLVTSEVERVCYSTVEEQGDSSVAEQARCWMQEEQVCSSEGELAYCLNEDDCSQEHCFVEAGCSWGRSMQVGCCVVH